jgi:hypothetical protein
VSYSLAAAVYKDGVAVSSAAVGDVVDICHQLSPAAGGSVVVNSYEGHLNGSFLAGIHSSSGCASTKLTQAANPTASWTLIAKIDGVEVARTTVSISVHDCGC